MKIHGNRVYLELPKMEETKISISPELKKELKEEKLEKFDRLKVFAVGKPYSNSVLEDFELEVGSEVFVDPTGLRRGVIFKIDGKELISVAMMDIMHTW